MTRIEEGNHEFKIGDKVRTNERYRYDMVRFFGKERSTKEGTVIGMREEQKLNSAIINDSYIIYDIKLRNGRVTSFNEDFVEAVK